MARQNTLVRVRLDGDSSGGIGVPSNNFLQRTPPGARVSVANCFGGPR